MPSATDVANAIMCLSGLAAGAGINVNVSEEEIAGPIVEAIEAQTVELVAEGDANTTEIITAMSEVIVAGLRPEKFYTPTRTYVPPATSGAVSGGWFSILFYAPFTNIGNATVLGTPIIPGASESLVVPAGCFGNVVLYETFADQELYVTVMVQDV